MFRKEFVDVITKTGMVPVKDLRPLVMDKDPLVISELGLLQFKFFDDTKPIPFSHKKPEFIITIWI